jgi:type IV secretion system protein TrbG
MHLPWLGFVLTTSTALGCCATKPPPDLRYDDEQPAVLQSDPAKPVQVVEVPRPLPLPGQLKPLPGGRSAREPGDPRERVDLANAAARVQPSRSGYVNAVQVFPYAEGALYQIYAAPGEVTDIALQEGEQLTGSGPVAAGDTVRWIIGDTESGPANARRIHVLVKPTRPDVMTNLVINTERRTYHMELRSTEQTYMASVSWVYAQDEIIALRRQNEAAAAAAPVDAGLDIDRLRFRYTVEGDNPPWRPLHAFDDGRKVYIEFPHGIAQGEMPPLFIVGPDGKSSELVNYRVRGSHMIVDRLFAAAELRLGDKNTERRVRIVRNDGR